MADSIDSPLLNIAPLHVRRVGETKRKGESQNRKRSFPGSEKREDDKNRDADHQKKDKERVDTETENGKEQKPPEAGSRKTSKHPDGTGLVIDITV